MNHAVLNSNVQLCGNLTIYSNPQETAFTNNIFFLFASLKIYHATLVFPDKNKSEVLLCKQKTTKPPPVDLSVDRKKHWTFNLSVKNKTSDEKVLERRMLPCTQLNKRWKISLMQQRGALCHFDSIWRDCIEGVAPEVRPHSLSRYYFRLSVSQ